MIAGQAARVGPGITALLARIATGTITATETVEGCLAAVGAGDAGPDGLGAIVTLDDRVLARAAAADRHWRRTGRLSGPLHGVPVLVKDVFETAGLATSFGCARLGGHVPRRDADVVRRLSSAGALVLGKSSTPDFAMSWLGASSTGASARNAHSTGHEAGGSSGGSAVGVAAGFAVAAIGSDTGGSVRVPASFNGVVGMRPTTGLLPTRGMSPLLAGQDTPGPIAGCVDDVALLLAVLAGSRELWSTGGTGLAGRRIGVLLTRTDVGAWTGADEVTRAFDLAIDQLRSAGARVVERVEVPGLDELLSAGSLYGISARADIDAFLASRPGLAKLTFRGLYDDGAFPSDLDLAHVVVAGKDRAGWPDAVVAEAKRAGRDLRGRVEAVLRARGLDALAYPTVRVPAPLRDRPGCERTGSCLLPVNTLLAAQAGLPAITLPAGRTGDGLPVGLELLGPAHGDRALLQLARAVEEVLSGSS